MLVREKVRERFMISLETDLLKKIDYLAEQLHANRPDVLEILIAFYFAYVDCVNYERRMNR